MNNDEIKDQAKQHANALLEFLAKEANEKAVKDCNEAEKFLVHQVMGHIALYMMSNLPGIPTKCKRIALRAMSEYMEEVEKVEKLGKL